QQALFRRCFERALRTSPTITLRGALRVEIGADGRVADAAFEGATAEHAALVECVVKAARAMRFPPFAGETVTVRAPLNFGGAD
ncbi:MAG: AgmX/PglI C-terminal domain-containing protein, partial [Myxococcales bacterium]|nr:AgmX/PglI C-terminal domain-containing protein [Myxococcales bacterium]